MPLSHLRPALRRPWPGMRGKPHTSGQVRHLPGKWGEAAGNGLGCRQKAHFCVDGFKSTQVVALDMIGYLLVKLKPSDWVAAC